jgi:hypothetical protein
MSPVSIFRPAALAAGLLFAVAPSARAETPLRNAGATDYLVDYMRHSHGFWDYAPNLPRFTESTPWWSVKALLMPGRPRAHALYLIGDDSLHLFPSRVGVFGWGATAGIQF